MIHQFDYLCWENHQNSSKMNDILKILLCTATLWFFGIILCRVFFHAMFQRGIAEENSREHNFQSSEVALKLFLTPEHFSLNQQVSAKAVTTTSTTTTADEMRITMKRESASIWFSLTRYSIIYWIFGGPLRLLKESSGIISPQRKRILIVIS